MRPSLIAWVISAAPFFPNNSEAMLNASVSVEAFFIEFIVSFKASSALFPSAVASCTAFFNPARAVVTSTPFASNCASRFTDWVRSNPISLRLAPFVVRAFSNVSIEIPVSWPALVISPKTLFTSELSTPNFVIMLSTLSIAVFKSVPFIFANLINSLERFSNSFPVAPNLVFTSPTATPTSSIVVGISENTLSATSVKLSRASPVAPVFVIMVS